MTLFRVTLLSNVVAYAGRLSRDEDRQHGFLCTHQTGDQGFGHQSFLGNLGNPGTLPLGNLGNLGNLRDPLSLLRLPACATPKGPWG
jgi:hypothetical protein